MHSGLWIRLIVAALATWRGSLLVVEEYGPFDVFEKIRQRAGTYYLDEQDRPLTFWGKLLSCLWCTSMWVSIPCTILVFTPLWYLMVPFALSAIAVFMDGVCNGKIR